MCIAVIMSTAKLIEKLRSSDNHTFSHDSHKRQGWLSMNKFIPLHIEAGLGGKMSMGDNYPDGKESICPVCGVPMEKGSLISARGILWTNKSRRIWDGEPMGPHSRNWRLSSYIEAYRCRKCRILRYEYLDIDSRMVQLNCPYCGTWNEYYKKESENDVRICQTCAKEF